VLVKERERKLGWKKEFKPLKGSFGKEKVGFNGEHVSSYRRARLGNTKGQSNDMQKNKDWKKKAAETRWIGNGTAHNRERDQRKTPRLKKGKKTGEKRK